MFHKIFDRKRRLKEMSFDIFNELLSEDKKKFENLNGEILISHCSGYDTIIIFFDISDYKPTHSMLLLKRFYCRYKYDRAIYKL